jgi:sulfur-oxidizing protein SoxA
VNKLLNLQIINLPCCITTFITKKVIYAFKACLPVVFITIANTFLVCTTAIAHSNEISTNDLGAEFTRVIPSKDLKSGSTFISNDLKSIQNNDDLNPAFLWVLQGEALWSSVAGKSSPSCASCHGESNQAMRGVSTHYPQVDQESGELVNLEARINLCRVRHQHLDPLKLESDQMLGITAYVALASRGLPMNVRVDNQNMEHFLNGRSIYYKRQGQINLACTHCHEQNWGGKLRGETISQGHINDYPAYRLEWQHMGSLHRRLRACLSGVRAYMYPLGSKELLDLELFLGWRSSDPKIKVETPGVRR